MTPNEAEALTRKAEQAVKLAAVMMAHRDGREQAGCWTGGYPGETCDGDLRCRCSDECEAEAMAILDAGYALRADTLDEAVTAIRARRFEPARTSGERNHNLSVAECMGEISALKAAP